MGWWSATIMGGDRPLDIISDFEDIILKANKKELKKLWKEQRLQEDFNDEDTTQFNNTHLDKALPELIKHINTLENDEYYDDHAIGGEVLGVIIMEYQAKMSTKTRNLILKCCDEDEWAKNNPERKQYVDDLRQKITAYDGKESVFVEQEGLFDAITKKLDTDTPTLINVGIGKH